jgi:hypothetical protein
MQQRNTFKPEPATIGMAALGLSGVALATMAGKWFIDQGKLPDINAQDATQVLSGSPTKRSVRAGGHHGGT